MHTFADPIESLLLSPRSDGKTWIVRTRFIYYVNEPGVDDIIVDENFITDFASTPKIIWWLFPPWGKYGRSAILHDRLYRYKDYTRKQSDRVFKKAMRSSATAEWKVQTIYWFTRAFGWYRWHFRKDSPYLVSRLSRHKSI